jgi:hypothetical protein
VAEPLFILNYETGEIEPWLGESFTANDTWTCGLSRLRDWRQVERRRALTRLTMSSSPSRCCSATRPT